MDGRVQLPVLKYIIAEYGIDYVDMITMPGPNRILAAVAISKSMTAPLSDKHYKRLVQLPFFPLQAASIRSP